MLVVLGLLSMEEVGLVLGAPLALLACLVLMVPLKLFLTLVVKACLLTLLAAAWMCLLPPNPSARHDVDEPWSEVEDLGEVGEGQVVGEPRRAQHALVTKVRLGGLGTLTFSLEPTAGDR